MCDPFIGEIRIFAGNYAPSGFAFCDGQSIPVSENEMLFSLFSNTYGGDGINTFNLPDFRGRLPVNMGQGTYLSPYAIGQKSGTETVTLTSAHLPAHHHTMQASLGQASSVSPSGNLLGNISVNLYDPGTASPSFKEISPLAVSNCGGGGPHSNMMPYLCLNFIVALNGIYPQRS
jgi:microcystin-dependent protein